MYRELAGRNRYMVIVFFYLSGFLIYRKLVGDSILAFFRLNLLIDT